MQLGGGTAREAERAERDRLQCQGTRAHRPQPGDPTVFLEEQLMLSQGRHW